MVNTGDVVRVHHQGCSYLARVEVVGERSARVRFLSKVPPIDGHRRKSRCFYLSNFKEYGKAGIAFVLSVGR